jgi:hypothetical protein
MIYFSHSSTLRLICREFRRCCLKSSSLQWVYARISLRASPPHAAGHGMVQQGGTPTRPGGSEPEPLTSRDLSERNVYSWLTLSRQSPRPGAPRIRAPMYTPRQDHCRLLSTSNSPLLRGPIDRKAPKRAPLFAI